MATDRRRVLFVFTIFFTSLALAVDDRAVNNNGDVVLDRQKRLDNELPQNPKPLGLQRQGDPNNNLPQQQNAHFNLPPGTNMNKNKNLPMGGRVGRREQILRNPNVINDPAVMNMKMQQNLPPSGQNKGRKANFKLSETPQCSEDAHKFCGHQKGAMKNNFALLDCLQGDTNVILQS